MAENANPYKRGILIRHFFGQDKIFCRKNRITVRILVGYCIFNRCPGMYFKGVEERDVRIVLANK